MLSGQDVLEFQQLVRQVVVADEVARYAVRLAAASRPGDGAPEFVNKWVKWGAGLRASQALILGSKARALMRGRYHVSVQDIRALSLPIMRHRIIPNFYAESEKVNSDRITQMLLETVPPPAERPRRQRVNPDAAAGLSYLDPAVIARLGTMELRARTIVEGFLSGLHRSPYKGFSVEFAEYRQYLPGDDLSTIDWKVYARSDRYYVKKYEEETNVDCHVLLDCSASMGYARRRWSRSSPTDPFSPARWRT